MKTHYAEPSVPTLTTTTDPEHTCPWGKTHLSHARFSRREWGQSWRCPRSVGCTTATNDEPPETAKATCKLLMSLLKSLSKLLTLASLNSFHSLENMTQTLVRFMIPPATAPAAVPDGIFVRDNQSNAILARRTVAGLMCRCLCLRPRQGAEPHPATLPYLTEYPAQQTP